MGAYDGEYCPEHGLYQPPAAAFHTRQDAVGRPGVAGPRAQRLLQHAEQLRRTCPGCRDITPTVGRWATRIRCRVRLAAMVDQFAPRCPWCSTVYEPSDPTGAWHYRCP
jgi:hypothetical protein